MTLGDGYKKDAFLVDYVEGGLCVDYTDARIVGRCNSGSNTNKGKELWDSLESKYMAEDSTSKKFLVSNFNNYKMVDSRPVMEHYNELLRILGQYTQHGLKMNESISVSSIIDKLPPSWKDCKHTLKHGKDDLSLVQLGSHLRIEESLRAQDSDKGKGKEVGPFVNMTEEGGKNKHHEQNKGNKRSNENNSGLFPTRNQSWNVESVVRLVTSKGIAEVVKRTTQMLVVRERGLRTNPKTKVDAMAWWIDFGAITHVCKDRCWFKTYEPVEDGSVLYMSDDHFAPVHGKGSVYESDKFFVYMSSSIVNSSLWHARKRMLEMSKDDLIPAIDENPKKCTTSPYTPQQNDVAERKNRALKKMVNSMLSYSGLSEGLWGEAMLTACYLLNRVPNKKNKTTPYEIWYKKRPNLSFLRVWGCRAVVRLPDPKRKTLGEKGIACIFVEYAEHSKAYRFYVIEPNDSISINSIIESRDAIFDENRFSSIPRPKDIIPNVQESQMDDHTDDVPMRFLSLEKILEPIMKLCNLGMLLSGKKQLMMRLVLLWKIILGFYPGCKPLGCKWIFKRKMKVDGTIDKFKARLVIQGFRQNEGIDYFDTYAPVARISTIRLLLALAAIHNLVIHQMDVKTAFLNGDLEEVYMKQPEGFAMSGNEHKVFDKTKKYLSSMFSMKDMGEVDVILGIKIKRENKGIVITQTHYIEKILKKFNREDCSSMSTPMDPVEKLKLNTGKHVDQLEYSRAIGCLMYAMTSTRPDIAYVVGRLSRFTSNPSRQHGKAIARVFKYLRGTMNYGLSFVGYPSVLEAYSDASWINHVEHSSSTSRWVFLLGGEWLRNLIHEIPIWPKPIAPISIRCDSAPTMARAYSQIYNGKSRHLGVRHSMVRELIRNGVISIEFVRTQHNLADHLRKGLARDLVQELKGPPM
nr:zinc finger, CCHC-type [Tanacetum cinerariifolium]